MSGGHDEKPDAQRARTTAAKTDYRATAREGSAPPPPTGAERRATRRADVKRLLRRTIAEGERLAVAVEVLGTAAHQRISDVCLDHVEKHVSAADLLAYPEATRLAYAEMLVPELLGQLRAELDEARAAVAELEAANTRAIAALGVTLRVAK